MAKKQKEPEETIETGMEVEATKGDLGEDDVSKPKVTEVVHDQQGKVDKVVVQKGIIFRKTIEIPADRIASINREGSGDENAPGKVIVDVSKKEAEVLTPVGAEALEPEKEYGLLDKVEQDSTARRETCIMRGGRCTLSAAVSAAMLAGTSNPPRYSRDRSN